MGWFMKRRKYLQRWAQQLYFLVLTLHSPHTARMDDNLYEPGVLAHSWTVKRATRGSKKNHELLTVLGWLLEPIKKSRGQQILTLIKTRNLLRNDKHYIEELGQGKEEEQDPGVVKTS